MARRRSRNVNEDEDGVPAMRERLRDKDRGKQALQEGGYATLASVLVLLVLQFAFGDLEGDVDCKVRAQGQRARRAEARVQEQRTRRVNDCELIKSDPLASGWLQEIVGPGAATGFGKGLLWFFTGTKKRKSRQSQSRPRPKSRVERLRKPRRKTTNGFLEKGEGVEFRSSVSVDAQNLRAVITNKRVMLLRRGGASWVLEEDFDYDEIDASSVAVSRGKGTVTILMGDESRAMDTGADEARQIHEEINRRIQPSGS
jgi:hypothetical protein